MNPNRSLKNIRLEFKCPEQCNCEGKINRKWYHQSCGNALYMTSKGDIFCDTKGCNTFFIKDAQFQCNKARQSQSWYKYKSMSQIFMALSCAIQESEQSLKQEDQIKFTKEILEEVNKQQFIKIIRMNYYHIQKQTQQFLFYSYLYTIIISSQEKFIFCQQNQITIQIYYTRIKLTRRQGFQQNKIFIWEKYFTLLQIFSNKL
ncbi:unnamed protein product [Paramecium sonneborni]|uniref:Uncharacterized protein n=1 Tax=Paramecium sonneborni TaxID=65129 RepID=A0A8S1RB65_9CILI|nr:unnamed protein product [Paramecium sonneborni]